MTLGACFIGKMTLVLRRKLALADAAQGTNEIGRKTLPASAGGNTLIGEAKRLVVNEAADGADKFHGGILLYSAFQSP